MYADSAADFTLALALTVLFGLLTWLAWKRRGLSALVTGSGVTLLPLALWLSRTLGLLSAIVDDVGSWATGLVFSPRVWVGLVVGAVAVLLIVSGSTLARRTTSRAPVEATGRRTPVRSTADPEMDEIEALLRKRGIS